VRERERERERPAKAITLSAFRRIGKTLYAVAHYKFCTSLCTVKKAVPFQAWSGPEGSRKLMFPDFMTSQNGGTVVSLTHRLPLPQEINLVLISVRG